MFLVLCPVIFFDSLPNNTNIVLVYDKHRSLLGVEGSDHNKFATCTCFTPRFLARS